MIFVPKYVTIIHGINLYFYVLRRHQSRRSQARGPTRRPLLRDQSMDRLFCTTAILNATLLAVTEKGPPSAWAVETLSWTSKI